MPVFPVLSETFILNRITGLIRRGHDVDIFAERRGDPRIMHDEVVRHGLIDRTTYWDVPQRMPARVMKALGTTVPNLFAKPMAIARTLNVARYGLAAASLVPLLAAAKLQRRRDYDVLLCHFGPTGLIVTALRDLGLLDGRVVTAFYGYDVTMIPRMFGNGVYRRLFADGDLCLPLCETFQRRIVELGCDPVKSVVHHIGVDCGRFTFSPRRPSVDGRVRVVSIARMVEKKGLTFGIRAVARVAKQFPKLEYVIIGDGPLRPGLERLVDELDEASRVRFVGWQAQEQVVQTLSESHILLVPSVTARNGDQEGTPTVLMEAAAMGMPIVSTLHSGIPEIVQDGVSGYLVAEKDIEALSDRLALLLAHPDHWEDMGRAGRKIVEERFNMDSLSVELDDIFTNLANAAGDRTPSKSESVATTQVQEGPG